MMLKRETQGPNEHDCPCCRSERSSNRTALWVLTMIALIATISLVVSRAENHRSRLEVEIQQRRGYR
jgi:hypothetical protein